MRKTIIVIIIFAFVIVGGAGFYLFNKTVGGLEKVNPDYTIEATALYNAFEAQEVEANRKYLDKVLLVKGIVEKVEIDKRYSSIILKAEGALVGGINCSFDHEVEDLSERDTVLIKGRCQGYLMDVVLTNCNIENE